MKPRFIIGIAVILIAVTAIMGFTIAGNSSLEVKVSELLAKSQRARPLAKGVQANRVCGGRQHRLRPKIAAFGV